MPEAENVVVALQSYTEVSPSGAGLRILIECPQFDANVRRPEIEVYAHSRFLTLTGHHLPDTPQTISSVPIDQIAALAPARAASTTGVSRLPSENDGEAVFSDEETHALWERIFAHDRYGEQHRRRFAGDTSLDGDDHSLTVLRLLNTLARWTRCDAARMRALMLRSPLANEKWFSKRGQGDWLDYQIADAIRYVGAKTT